MGSAGESNTPSQITTNCGHSHHHGISENNKRPFKSETNLFSSTAHTCLQPIRDRQIGLGNNRHNAVVNASNGFIPISQQHVQENKLTYDEDDSHRTKCEGDSEVTMFKTKVLYHSRSDFRPIGLTEDRNDLSGNKEQEANV